MDEMTVDNELLFDFSMVDIVTESKYNKSSREWDLYTSHGLRMVSEDKVVTGTRFLITLTELPNLP